MKKATASRKRTVSVMSQEDLGTECVEKVDRSPLEPKTEMQKRYMNAIRHHQLTFGLGPAGTGKTYIAAAIAADMLAAKQVERIVVTRPAVEAGESMGFLPGELEEKYAPFLAPFRDVLDQRLGKSFVDYLLKTGKIEAVPFAYMRGRTFRSAVVILDEAQNATHAQMKLFLTRIGEDCRVVVNGDPDQADIDDSGLLDAVARTGWIPAVKAIEFGLADIVRSGLVQDIVSSYSRNKEHHKAPRA